MENTSASSPHSSATPIGSGAAAQAGGTAAGAGGVAIGGSVTGNVYVGAGAVEKTPAPRQIPRVLEYYTRRPREEEALTQALLDPDDDIAVTRLYGLSGTGKTALAATVVKNLSESDFPDGILWGDLASHEPNEMLWLFMCALDNRLRRESPPTRTSLRDMFSPMLSNRRLLIVLNNVRDAHQLDEMLPSNLGRSRALAISIPRLTGLKIKCHELRLGSFREDEALALFTEVLGQPVVDANREILREISGQLDYLPQLIASTALSFKEGQLSPSAYLRTLRDSAERGRLLGRAAADGLAVTVQALTPEQVDLFELMGVLGDGDWHYHMLAAVALRPATDVKAALDVFAANGLIEPVDKDRYRANALVREHAQERFNQRSDYAIQSAYHLLARYCLDRAQDLEASLRFRAQHGAPDSAERAEALTLAFREGLLPESSHIRKVLEWAAQRENWNLIRRFAYLPYMGLAQGLVVNGGGRLKAALSMATIREPVITPASRQRIRVPTFIGSLGNLLITPSQHREATRFSLELDITAGRLIDGIFDQVDLIDVNWIGVRAAGLVLKECDLIGSRFLACDLNYNVWRACDARRADLTGSGLRYALLCDVNLRGAVLRGVDLTGAVLYGVDLRGADLRGANLTAAQLRNVNLEGCKLDRVRWAGMSGMELQLDDTTQLGLEELRRAASEPPEEAIEERYRSIQEDTRDLQSHKAVGVDWSRADLRAVTLSGAELTYAQLEDADLRAARLDAKLDGASLRDASLRAADLSTADLTDANLELATLRAAVFRGAGLKRAKLKEADLYVANLSGAVLREADLTRADLTCADLANADLSNAKLASAHLVEANLANAKLVEADLSHADLTGASCVAADFTHAKVRDEQLAQAADLSGATLPTGQIVVSLSGEHADYVFPPETDLRFAHLSGHFTRLSLVGRNLTGLHLEGQFEDLDLSGAILPHARFNGQFARIKLASAILVSAVLDGQFTGVDLSKAILVKAALNGQIDADRMRGAKMPDGSLYDGRFNYPGDLDDARAAGIDTNDKEAMAEFYAAGQSKDAEQESSESTRSNG